MNESKGIFRNFVKKSSSWGIAMTGGGFNCAWAAGIVKALVSYYQVSPPDIIVASSGNTITASYWASNQIDEGIDTLINKLSDERIVSKKNFMKKIDLDLIMKIIEETLNVKKVGKSKMKTFLALTNYDTAKTEYYHNHQRNIEWLKIMEASMAIPVFQEKKIIIDSKRFIDGDVSAPLAKHIREVIFNGIDSIIAINSQVPFLPTDVWLFLSGILIDSKLRNAFLEGLKDATTSKLQMKYPYHEIIYLSPDTTLPTMGLNNSKSAIVKSIEMGFTYAKRNKTLDNFLTKHVGDFKHYF